MDIISIIKGFIDRYKNNGMKKNAEYLLMILAIGIIIMIAGRNFFTTEQKNTSNREVSSKIDFEQAVEASALLNEKYYKTSDIENILSKINGAGRVEIMITYAGSVEAIPALNEKETESTTNEKDGTGGTRNLKQKDVESDIVFEDDGKIKRPYIVKELYPVPMGVVVVADGADNFEIKQNLIKATQALLDLPLHKIQIFKRR